MIKSRRGTSWLSMSSLTDRGNFQFKRHEKERQSSRAMAWVADKEWSKALAVPDCAIRLIYENFRQKSARSYVTCFQPPGEGEAQMAYTMAYTLEPFLAQCCMCLTWHAHAASAPTASFESTIERFQRPGWQRSDLRAEL